MARYTMAIDLNRCVNCKACNAACKETNGVPIGSFRNWVTRKQSSRITEDNGAPSHDFYYLPMQCQHCDNPQCVEVCPTGASFKADDGTVQIDTDACIGCQLCMSACPYGVRYYNEDLNIVDKCNLCYERIADGELPQCVVNCVGMSKWFGDLDEGVDSFKGACGKTLGEFVQPYDPATDVYQLEDEGNGPSFVYILRKHTWQA